MPIHFPVDQNVEQSFTLTVEQGLAISETLFLALFIICNHHLLSPDASKDKKTKIAFIIGEILGGIILMLLFLHRATKDPETVAAHFTLTDFWLGLQLPFVFAFMGVWLRYHLVENPPYNPMLFSQSLVIPAITEISLTNAEDDPEAFTEPLLANAENNPTRRRRICHCDW